MSKSAGVGLRYAKSSSSMFASSAIMNNKYNNNSNNNNNNHSCRHVNQSPTPSLHMITSLGRLCDNSRRMKSSNRIDDGVSVNEKALDQANHSYYDNQSFSASGNDGTDYYDISMHKFNDDGDDSFSDYDEMFRADEDMMYE